MSKYNPRSKLAAVASDGPKEKGKAKSTIPIRSSRQSVSRGEPEDGSLAGRSIKELRSSHYHRSQARQIDSLETIQTLLALQSEIGAGQLFYIVDDELDRLRDLGLPAERTDDEEEEPEDAGKDDEEEGMSQVTLKGPVAGPLRVRSVSKPAIFTRAVTRNAASPSKDKGKGKSLK